MKKVFLFLFAALFLLAACSDDEEASQTITGASGTAVALNGSWSEGCVADGTQSDKETAVISGTTFTGTGSTYFTNTTCAGSPELNSSFGGTFTMGSEVEATLAGATVTATKSTGTITTAKMTVNDADTVVLSNLVENCGYSDWAVGVAKDVLGTECFPTAYLSFKEIDYIDDTVTPHRWHSGDEDTEGADGYPTELETTYEERQ